MSPPESPTRVPSPKQTQESPPRKRIGVFGGSFNPIHLGHALLAVTVQQTKTIDQVVLVPVYKHAVKKNLLPFEHRFRMCQLAVASFDNVVVSRVEERVQASNGAMLQGLKEEYPDADLIWICGDDFFRWMDRPKGIETLQECAGIIAQRRLHRRDDQADEYYREPVNMNKVTSVVTKLNLSIEFIYGELPHFSSTLVRKTPGKWRSFLTQGVVQYLDEHPALLGQLMDDLKEAVDDEPDVSININTKIVLLGLDVSHALQYERGVTGLHLSSGDKLTALRAGQTATDALLQEVATLADVSIEMDEVRALLQELLRTTMWLQDDRQTHAKYAEYSEQERHWMTRLSLVEKFNPRIDVLISSSVRALWETIRDDRIAELLLKWCEGKEALGRLRAFVCACGRDVPQLVRASTKLRERLCETIDTKDRMIQRVLIFESHIPNRFSAPEALHKLLQGVSVLEYQIMGCFAASTSQTVIHHVLLQEQQSFDLDTFFEKTTTALDFLLNFAKALAASACANV